MSHRHIWIAYSVCALCLSFGVQQASAAFFLPLGDLPGGEFSSTAVDVSADGSVVVGWSAVRESTSTSIELGGVDAFDVFRWTSDGGMATLGVSFGPGFIYFGSTAVSADGAVVVGCCAAEGSFQWSESDGMVTHFDGLPNDVSADGFVVVGRLGGEAVRWTAGGGMAGLGVLPTANSYSEALGVSADGAVVVGSSHSVGGAEEAFRWTSDGGMVGLGGLPAGEGFFSSRAEAVSANGTVVIGSSPVRTTSLTSLAQAFRWTMDGGMVGLGELPGGSQSSRARGVSADGSVVVGTANYGEGPPEAFVWDEPHGMRTVESVLADLGVDTTGWSLWAATAISANGTTIVGWGANPFGQHEAWLANISAVPEPGAGVLGLLTAGGLLVQRRRIWGFSRSHFNNS
jgi:probable HAF family extracellular repeat protein